MIRIFLAPIRYLAIHGKGKPVIDWVIPIVFAFFSTIFLYEVGKEDLLSGTPNLLSKLSVLTSILPGFYIAALAAIATFDGQNIDEVMPEPSPYLVEKLNGVKNDIPLTRRRFLTLLFSFLCWESLLIFIITVFAGLIEANALVDAGGDLARYGKAFFIVSLLIVFWQLIAVTSFGLYYLGDRLHRPTY